MKWVWGNRNNARGSSCEPAFCCFRVQTYAFPPEIECESSLIICLQYMDLFYSQTMISFLLFPHHRIFIKSALHTQQQMEREGIDLHAFQLQVPSLLFRCGSLCATTHRLYYEYLHFIPACLQKHTLTTHTLFHHSSILLILWIWFNLRESVMYGTFFAFRGCSLSLSPPFHLFIVILFRCNNGLLSSHPLSHLFFSFLTTHDLIDTLLIHSVVSMQLPTRVCFFQGQ